MSRSLLRHAPLLRRNLCSHPDFAPTSKPSSGTTADRIASQLLSSKVVLYMKGSPAAPQCGFSFQTSQILNTLAVPYKHFNVLEDEHIRQGIKAHSAWPTIPQLYVQGEFVGGCDIVVDMAKSGELRTLFSEAGAYEEKNDE